jgi:chemotaxis protein MotB
MAKKRRSGGGGDDGGGERWLGTYGDMVTLLMAFFVMLYAISQVDEAKFIALVSGLGMFGNTTNTEGMLDSGPDLLVGANGGQPSSGDQVGELSLHPKSNQQTPKGEDGQKDEEAAAEQLAKVERQLDAALKRAGLSAKVAGVRADPRGAVISVSSDEVLFALGSTDLSPLGRRIIGAVAYVVKQYDDEVVVEGHTDNVPLRRPGYSNWNLSTDRAVAVLERLYRSHGVAQRRMVASGYGEFHPLSPNTSAANRARNRRVDVLLRLDED